MRRLTLLLLLLAAPVQAQTPGFRARAAVVQVNDVYRIEGVDNGGSGGLGRVATIATRTAAETGLPVAVLHAGDYIAPSLESRYFAGLQMIDAMNFLHTRAPLYAVPGNHEFDERQPAMIAGAIRASIFPWLASNVRLATGDTAVDGRLGGDTVVVMNGLRVGIFSLTYSDSPRGYAEFDTAVVALAEASIRRLERRSDLIVGLTHLPIATDRRIAALRRGHPKFVWIAGGHEHYMLSFPLTDATALITKGDSNARRIWTVLLGHRNGRPAVEARPVTLDSTVVPDPEYQRTVVDRWTGELQRRVPYLDQQIGVSSVTLDALETTVRERESNWGNWLTDLMRNAFPEIRADVAFLNSGTLRIDDTFGGEVRWEHLERTFGFPTNIGLVWLRGSDLRELVLERSVEGIGEGPFLQLSGMRFAYDRTRPAGDRVTRVEIQRGDGWAPLADDSLYVAATSSFLIGGGDGYRFGAAAVRSVPAGPDLKYMALAALANSLVAGTPIAPRVEGRITDSGPPR